MHAHAHVPVTNKDHDINLVFMIPLLVAGISTRRHTIHDLEIQLDVSFFLCTYLTSFN